MTALAERGLMVVGISRIARFSVVARIVLAALLACTLMSIIPATNDGAAGRAFADTASTPGTQSTGFEQRVVRVGYSRLFFSQK